MTKTAEKKLRRNKAILARYNELKKIAKTRTAMAMVADEFGLELPTIKKILFEPGYSNSPLAPKLKPCQTLTKTKKPPGTTPTA